MPNENRSEHDSGRNRTGRRTVLKKGAIVASGLHLAATPGVGANGKTVRLPKFTSGDEVLEYFEVPREWDVHRKHVKNVQRRVIDRYADDTGVHGIGLSRSSKTYGGKNGLQVTLAVSDSYDGTDIPASIDGVPVTTDLGERGRFGGCSISDGTENCVNKESDTTVRGGEYVSGGTAATKMSDGDGNEFLLAVAHLFRSDSNCPSDVNGSTAKTYGGTKIGTVDASNVVDDWAVIDLNSDSDTDTRIDDNANYPHCKGVVSEATLQDWESRSKSNRPCLYQMGRTTGKTTGRLKYANYAETSWNSCVDYDSDGSADGVYTYCGFGQGDSGGPTWHAKNGDAYLVSTTALYHSLSGSICGGNDFGPDSSGMGAYAVEAENSNLSIP